MKKLIPIFIAFALTLGGCANLTNAWNVLTSTQVTASEVAVAGNTFDGLEAIATGYLRLVRCSGSNGPICRDPKATVAIINAVRAGRVARNNLEQFFKDHPGQLGPSGLYDALQTSITTLQNIFAQYGVTAGAVK
ncbi:MAG: hypothetical protein KGL39_38345 [Patescibacteria group bacterium]|nr:hypothetical protein [Patescibacteria group bacterium]